MKQFLICLAIIALTNAARAEEEPGALRKMKPPKGVKLTPEQETMLEEANHALEAGHKLLLEKNDPAAAVEQLRRAYTIANQLKLLKPEQLMTGTLAGKGTPEDKIESEGGMERIIEIAANMAVEAPAEVENGLHKRKIVKQAADESKKLAADQKQLTDQIAAAQTQPPQPSETPPPSQQGGKAQKTQGVQPNVQIQQQGTAGEQQPQDKQTPQNQQPNQPGQQTAGAQQNKPADQQDPKTAQAQQNKTGDANQNNQAQQNPKNEQTAGAQQNQPQDQKGEQTADGQKNQPQNQKGEQTAGGQQNQPQNQKGEQAAGGQQGSEQLARNQENIAQALHRIATALTPAGKNDPDATKASQAFRRAGDEAARTAELLRNNQLQPAAAASKQVERAIGEAVAAAGATAGQRQAETIAALQKQLEGAKNAQQKILGQTQQIQKNADGTTASAAVQQDRARALAIEQGKLKPQLENVQKTLAELAENGNGAGRPNSAQNSAREEIANAANELQRGRSKQAVVNAAMRLANGEPESAATAMAQVQNALNAARRRVDAAANALSGNNAGLEQEYRQLQQAAAALRRLQQDAKGAKGNQESGAAGQAAPPAKTEANAQTPPNKNGQEPPPNSAHDKDGVAISATWGGMLNRSAQQIHSDLQKLVPGLSAVNPEAAKQIAALASKNTAFERDREGSLAQVASLLKEVEKIELALARKVAGDDERKALNNYRKDEIPQPYRKAVAAYYEELSKDK